VRIAIGQLWQETNTFNPLPTTRRDFEDFGVFFGQEMVERMAQTNELGGFIQSLNQWPENPDIVGLARLSAWPGGTATHDTFIWLRAVLVDTLTRALPVDGVLIALHGAMAADAAPDVTGAVLQALRQVIGPNVPLVATLDLHANVTAQMVAQADALVLYHTVPHVDVAETGQRGAHVLRRIMIERARPVSSFQKIPMVVPAQSANTQDPTSVSHGFRLRFQELETHPRILSAGLATVQPWLDIPNLGSAVLVVSDGDKPLAEASCGQVAADVWAKRRAYLSELVPVADAVREAFAIREGLVVLSDSADATTSGAPGDSTWILRELLHYDWPRPVLVTLVAPEVVAEARQRGIGADWTVALGGVRDHRYSQSVTVRARVARLFEARFIMSGHLARNMPIDMGPAVVLSAGNIDIVVTARSGPHFAPQLFQAAGIDPFAAQVLVAKSPCGFRAAYADRAKKILVVQAPGCAPADFWNYDFHNIPRPLWPWDALTAWTPNGHLLRGGLCHGAVQACL
jgi:microcystin degradation protein MlrC